MTCAWPMDTAEVDAAIAAKGGEKLGKTDIITNDHPWHRSLWFSYQSVNGANLGGTKTPVDKTPRIRLVFTAVRKQRLLLATSGWTKTTKNCWKTSTITCSTDGENRIIDFDITLKATEGDVVFGDEKDGVSAMGGCPTRCALTQSKAVRLSAATEKSTKTKSRPEISDGGAILGKRAGGPNAAHPVTQTVSNPYLRLETGNGKQSLKNHTNQGPVPAR